MYGKKAKAKKNPQILRCAGRKKRFREVKRNVIKRLFEKEAIRLDQSFKRNKTKRKDSVAPKLFPKNGRLVSNILPLKVRELRLRVKSLARF